MTQVNAVEASKSQTMSSTEIARLTGKEHKHVLRDIREQLYTGLYGYEFDSPNLGYPSIQGLTAIIDIYTKRTKEILLDHEHTLTLMTGYDVKARHKINKRWVELETTPKQPVSLPPMSEAAQTAIIFADYLRLPQSGKLQLLNTVNESYGSPMILPSYGVDAPPSEMTDNSSMPVSSATELLKKHGAGFSAISFNQCLERIGIIETLTRKSTGKTTKTYKSVTEKGLEYGKNDTSVRSPLETQPHWYIHKFGELLAAVVAS